MNQRFCKIYSWIFLAITIGAFIVCLDMVCEECGQLNSPPEITPDSFNQYMRSYVTSSVSFSSSTGPSATTTTLPRIS